MSKRSVHKNISKKCQQMSQKSVKKKCTQHYPKKVSTNVQKKCFTATSWQLPLLNVTLQQIGLLDILFWEFYRLFSQTIQWIHLDKYMSSNILKPLCRQILEIFLNYFPKHFPHILNKKCDIKSKQKTHPLVSLGFLTLFHPDTWTFYIVHKTSANKQRQTNKQTFTKHMYIRNGKLVSGKLSWGDTFEKFGIWPISNNFYVKIWQIAI